MEGGRRTAAGDAQTCMRDEWSGKVMTVRGPVAPDRLGITLPHEHILLHHSEPDLVLSDLDAAVAEVARFADAGGGTVVEMTNIGLRRDPAGLRHVAEQTGVLIVMGCGYYKAGWHPGDMDGKSPEAIAEQIVHDVVVGADGTDIRAGIIGEIGISSMPRNEEKVLRAAAWAQRHTGAAINVHLDIGVPESLRTRALDLLKHEGADLSRVVTSHFRLIPEDEDLHVRMVGRGTYVEFDLFGHERLRTSTIPDYSRESDALRGLIERGCLGRILLSSDTCYRQTLTRNGGWGYAHLVANVVPRFLKHGISESELHTVMVQNPKNLFPLRLG